MFKLSNNPSVVKFESQSQSKQANDLALLKDILYSQESANKVFGSKWLDAFDFSSINQMRDALNYLLETKDLSQEDKLNLIKNSKNIYYTNYISPQEFLSEKCFNKDVLDGMYSNVKEWFLGYWNFPNRDKKRLILYTATRAGKSHTSALCMLYHMLLIGTLRNPKAFYCVTPATQIGIVLLSFNLDKAREVLLNVMDDYARNSKIFTWIKFKDNMRKIEKRNEKFNNFETLYYLKNKDTMYGMGGSNVVLASDYGKFLGLSVIAGVMSELTQASSGDANKGWSDEYVDEMYNTLSTRIKGSFPHNLQHTGLILDSQPHSLTQMLDRKIYNGEYEANDPEVKVIRGSQMDIHPEWFPDFPKNSFKVFTGTAGSPPRILEENENLDGLDPTRIYDVPKERKPDFLNSLFRNIPDVLGVPLGEQINLISDYTVINDIFDIRLKNNLTYAYASTLDNPKNLIFNQIKRDFFVESLKGLKYYFKPWIPRVIGIDQSYATDATGITIMHCELNENGDIIYIIDMNIALIPRNYDEISLQAIIEFIKDLKEIGNLPIKAIVFDQFQSKLAQQNLERLYGSVLDVVYHSMDLDIGTYLNFIQDINLRRLKAGRNIFLKNNLKSIYIKEKKTSNNKISRKIDHRDDKKGVIHCNDEGNWDKSLLGLFAKDVLDSAANAYYYLATKYVKNNQIADILTEQDLNFIENKELTLQKSFVDYCNKNNFIIPKNFTI